MLLCFLDDFGLETILYFTQASHKKVCQPNFDHFVWLLLYMKNPDFLHLHFHLLQFGKTITKIHPYLTITFPKSCPTLRTIQHWGCEIQSGTFTLEKGVNSGQPQETRAPENIAHVKELIEQNPWMLMRCPMLTLISSSIWPKGS